MKYFLFVKQNQKKYTSKMGLNIPKSLVYLVQKKLFSGCIKLEIIVQFAEY